MKNVTIDKTGPPSVLQCGDASQPHPGDQDLVVEVAACGVCGHDLADRAGLTHTTLPTVLGHEVSGTVVQVGPKVTRFSVGDRVANKQFTTCGMCLSCRSGQEVDCPDRRFIYGGYAGFVALPADTLLHVPEEVPLEEASIVACAVGTCLQALVNIANLRPDESIVISGAGGGLGVHSIQVAKALGADVIAITSSADKIAALKGLGADEVILADGRYAEGILDVTQGRGADVVLDNVGHPAVFDQCFRALAKRGRYVFTGQVYREKISLYPAFVFGKEALITGSGPTLMSTFMRSMALVRDGRVRPIVQRYALKDATSAHADMEASRVFGRVVLIP